MSLFPTTLSGTYAAWAVRMNRFQKAWARLNRSEQVLAVKRAAGIAALGGLFAAFIPLIPAQYEAQRAEAAFRTQVAALHADPDADFAERGADTSALFAHDWVDAIEAGLDRTPRSALSRFAMYDRDAAALAALTPVSTPELRDQSEHLASEHTCLAQAIYYEARSETLEGQLAVAEVVTNRVADHRYPNTVCEVVFQGSERETGCQFTFTCDGALRRRPSGSRWETSKTVAAHVLMDLNEPKTRGATHYHATYVDPVWNVGLIHTRKIGTHIFYRFPRGAEWAQVRNAVARKRAARRSLIQTVAAESTADLNYQTLVAQEQEALP